MDPQKLSQLDPKLRNAYQRVMGTVIPEPQVAPIQTQAPPLTNNYTVPAPPNPIPNPQPQPEPQQPTVEPQPAINPQPVIPTQPTSNFVQMNSQVPAAPPAATPPTQNFTVPTPQAQTMVSKKKKGGIMMPIFFVIVGLVSIAGYTFFWTKFFNLKLPFLP